MKEFDPSGSLSCVYWNISEWIVDGCSVLKTNSSYTVCSCVHLSTFALIMQTSRPPESDSQLDLLNLVCVIVGLLFFSLALLTFALCQWSPGVNNVARINICISLLLAHLLFLLTQQFLSVIRPQQLNMIIFIKIGITLNSTLKNLNAEVSQMKQTKIMTFKTLSQCVVLGCPWILGFFSNDNKVLEIIFLILNSQQGTFIFLIYCVLNKEVRQQYRKFFRCLCCGCKHH